MSIDGHIVALGGAIGSPLTGVALTYITRTETCVARSTDAFGNTSCAANLTEYSPFGGVLATLLGWAATGLGAAYVAHKQRHQATG
jgi:hypothetical protein